MLSGRSDWSTPRCAMSVWTPRAARWTSTSSRRGSRSPSATVWARSSRWFPNWSANTTRGLQWHSSKSAPPTRRTQTSRQSPLTSTACWRRARSTAPATTTSERRNHALHCIRPSTQPPSPYPWGGGAGEVRVQAPGDRGRDAPCLRTRAPWRWHGHPALPS